VPFRIQQPGLSVVLSPVICFEDIFPHHTRDQIVPDTDLLLEMTNDGWFGESGAQWQHCANASFRAVENGVPLVRCSNNGISCWIDAFGRLRDVAGGADGNVYGAGFLRIAVALPPVEEGHPRTWYFRHGDVFGWTCLALASWRAIRSRFRRVEKPTLRANPANPTTPAAKGS
jgi:apolipoprotein N-acyltransferase